MKIELPKDWANLIRTVHRNPKINVVEMQQSQFYNFQKLLTTQYIHRKINSVKEKVNWNKIKWIQCRKVDPGVLYYKYTFDDSEELFKMLSLKRNRNMTRSQSEDTAPVAPLMPLNQRPIKLPAPKVRDLQSFLEYLQPSSRPFYESLETGPEMEDIVSCSDEEN